MSIDNLKNLNIPERLRYECAVWPTMPPTLALATQETSPCFSQLPVFKRLVFPNMSWDGSARRGGVTGAPLPSPSDKRAALNRVPQRSPIQSLLDGSSITATCWRAREGGRGRRCLEGLSADPGVPFLSGWRGAQLFWVHPAQRQGDAWRPKPDVQRCCQGERAAHTLGLQKLSSIQ